MKLNDLIQLASDHYDDRIPESYWNFEDERFNPDGDGDTLAKFIVLELEGTFEPNATTGEQLEEAIRVMQSARDQLNDLIAGLEHAANEEARGEIK